MKVTKRTKKKEKKKKGKNVIDHKKRAIQELKIILTILKNAARSCCS